MIFNSTDVKNSFGKILKLLDYEDVIVKKNGRAVAKIIRYSEPLDPMGLVKESIPEYIAKDKKVSYEDFLKFVANSDNRYELLDGQIYLMASPSTTHQNTVGKLYGEIYPYFKGKKCTPFVAPFDITLSVDERINVLQPDLGVICNMSDDVDENDRYMGIPPLVVEVLSPSSISRDMVKKLNTYMLSGIREYWIVNPMTRLAKVYHFKDYDVDGYLEYSDDQSIRSIHFDGLVVPW
jgi:Uma2 family endonuclease